MKKSLLYMLTLFLTIIGIFLFSMAQKGIVYGTPSKDKIELYVTAQTTLQNVVALVPKTSIVDEKANIVQVPAGEVLGYINVFTHKPHVASAIPYISTPHFSFGLYGNALKDRVSQYLKGDFGSIGVMNRIFPATDYIAMMTKRSLAYLVPGFLFAVFIGLCMALLASIKPNSGKLMDVIHALLVTIPDFFLVALIWIGAIYLSKMTTHRLVLVVQINNEVPFLIPFLTISLVPCVLIYGTMRTALRREWAANYVTTALAKGLTPIYILRKHLLPNTLEDLTAVLPKAFTLAVASMAVAEVICNIIGLGGFMKNPYIYNVSALPLTSMVLGGIVLAFHLAATVIRKLFVVQTKEAKA
jgi:ABC-type dipeptide/oligopeptide/nickel transport system permease component